MSGLGISDQEFNKRCTVLCDYLVNNNLEGIVLFDNNYIQYYSGFAFIPTERPIALVITNAGERILFVPALEKHHAESHATINSVVTYTEYPDHTHPMNKLRDLLHSRGLVNMVGADLPGYPWVFGYRGSGLKDIIRSDPVLIPEFIEDQMMLKSESEINLIRESVKWGHLAHTLLQKYTQAGKTESEVSMRASMEATLAMYDAIGPIYRSQSVSSSPCSAGYRGQIGRNSYIPHALANNIRFKSGDLLVSGAGAIIWGYHSELERTMIIDKPNDKQKYYFSMMCTLQELALNSMRPGVLCSEIDYKVRKYYEDHDLMPFWKHHVGHAIGLRYHEGPFLDIGEDTIMQPGMVFTVEPGIYVPGIGGFRHSDTVLITENGVEELTYYPKDIDYLIL
jgi:Xaa-Pro aminopeptidase